MNLEIEKSRLHHHQSMWRKQATHTGCVWGLFGIFAIAVSCPVGTTYRLTGHLDASSF